jgi:hypothetical protein
MAIKDVLVGLTSYPEPTAVSVVDSAVSIAESLRAQVAALACEIHVEVPGHFFSGAVAGLPGILAGEAAKSRKHASDLLAAFEVAAERAGVARETILQSSAVPETLVEYARLRDLTILSVRDSGDRWYAEAVILIGQANAHRTVGRTRAPFRAAQRRRGLGFQPCCGARDIRCASAARTSETGSRCHRHQ